MMKSVSHIFGSEAKVKIMRLFVFNPETFFPPKEVASRSKVRSNIARRELNALTKAGLIKKLSKGYVLNQNYEYLPAVENFLIDASPITDKELIKKLSRAGSLKLVLVSGAFVHDHDARVDLLVVGDNISQAKLSQSIEAIEADIGREMSYSIFETADFEYRFGVYDKLIRDILESHHRKVLDKLGI